MTTTVKKEASADGVDKRVKASVSVGRPKHAASADAEWIRSIVVRNRRWNILPCTCVELARSVSSSKFLYKVRNLLRTPHEYGQDYELGI